MRHIFFLSIIVFLGSCVSSHNYVKYKSSPDKNDRVEINGAYWENKINPIGVGAIVVGTGLGAYAGSKTEIFRSYSNESHTKNNEVLNTITGGLIGFGVSSMANYLIAKQGKVKKVQDMNQMKMWLQEYDYNLLPLSGSFDSYTVGNLNSKQTFTAYKYSDVKDFITLFGNNSDETVRFVERSISNISRKDLPALLQDFKNAPTDLIVKKYIEKSINLDEAIEANRRFPNNAGLAESTAFNFVNDIHTMDSFLSEFKNSKHKSLLCEKGLTYVKNVSDYEKYIKHFTLQNKYAQEFYKKLVSTINSCSALKKMHSFYDKAVNDNDLLKSVSKNFEHSDLVCAYESFHKNPNKKYIAATYLTNAKSISTVYRSMDYFKSHYSFEAFDNLSYKKVSSANDANEYLIYFPNGNHTRKAQVMIENALNTEVNRISNLSGNNLIKEAYRVYRIYGSFVYKSSSYRSLENIILPVLNESEAMYDALVNAKNELGQLMIMQFETKDDVPAYIFLDEVVKKVQQNHIWNPWISSIYGFGAKGNKGLIYGRYCCPALLSPFDFALFSERLTPDVKRNPDIIRYESHYAGNLLGDIARITVQNFFNAREEKQMSGSIKDIVNCYNVLSSNYEIYCNQNIEINRIMCDSKVKEFYYSDRPISKGCEQPAQSKGYYEMSIFGVKYIGADYTEAVKSLCNCR